MSAILSAELAATCSALGYYDPATKKYFADGDTLETVKDLIRYLRRDDENHDIRRQLGDSKVVITDLLPMLKSYWEETELFDVLLRLLVNLTTPALMLWNEEIPTEKIARNYFLQISDHLKNYKEAFVDQDVWSALSRRLSKILEVEYAERGDENSLIIERILILLRNILYVPIDPYLERPDDDASVHDQVLWALHQSGMLDIILYMSSSPSEQAYYMHILEILCFMLREQKASELAKAELQRSETEKQRDEAALVAIRNREAIQKQQKMRKYAGARHSRFGGTFVVKSLKSISDNELIYHKPLNKLDELNFDVDKKKPKTPKNRLPVTYNTYERRSAFTIRLFLKEFCIEFLNGAYNTFINYIKRTLVRGKAQNNDESYYFWAVRFFMEMNRCYKFNIKLVSETMSVETFHYIQREMEKQFDLMQTEKKKSRLISRRLHLALLAYRELFLTLCVMDLSPDGTVRDSAKVIKSNIFYIPEYRELILTLLVTYDELKSSDLYLKDLIETQHIIFKMLEKFCGKTGSVVIKKPSRKKSKKKVNKSQPQTEAKNWELLWDEVAPQLTTILEAGTEFTTDIAPFDAASEVPIDDQKADAMKNIQRKLREGDYENAIGLLHAAREVWPENDDFGNSNMSSEEEFLALKDIFFANIDDENNQASQQPDEDEFSDNEEDEDDYDDEPGEREFKVGDFVKRLAHPKVVRAAGLALKTFDSNTAHTNHCIVKLLHRIAFDCKMYVMLFQLSIFRTFQRIYSLKDLPEYTELTKFATYIVREFFKVAEKNKKVYMEALFWKSQREAYEIVEGYGNSDQKAAHKTWTEEQEDELRRLFMEHQEKQIEEDVVDWITSNLIDNTRTRRAVLKKMKELMLIRDVRNKSVRAPRVWGEEEEEQLRELYEQFKDAADPVGCIIERLAIRRPRNRIIEKMLTLGIIQDRSEVRKKRGKKSDKSGAMEDNDEESGRSDDESDENDYSGNEENVPPGSSKPKKQQTQRKQSQKRNTQRKSTNKKSKAPKKASKTEIIKILLDLEPELSEALEWLKESFSDAVEDINDSGSLECSLPLVPIMDYAVEAVENVKFQLLLRAMLIVQPEEGQEIYWRIPESMSAATLTEYIEILTQAIDKTLELPAEPESEEAVASTSQTNIEQVVTEVFNRKNKGLNFAYNGTENSDQESRDSFVQENNTNASENEASYKKKKSNLIDSDSEEDSRPNPVESQNNFISNEDSNSSISQDPASQKQRQRKSKFIASDSEEESETLTMRRDDFVENEESNPNDSLNQSLKKKKQRISKLIDSESEEENPENEPATAIVRSENNFTTSEESNETQMENTSSASKKRSRQLLDSDDSDGEKTQNNQEESAIENSKYVLDNGEDENDASEKKKSRKRMKVIDSDED